MNSSQIITISRPRFWIYILGPFLVGLAAYGDIQSIIDHGFLLVLLVLFFTFPANFLVYGINDIYDYETDLLNPKKQDYEALVSPQDHKQLYKVMVLSLLPFLGLLPLLNLSASLVLFIFLFSSIFYSAKPIRAKARPGLDVLFSSIIYVTPGIIGFFSLGNQALPWLGVIASLLWAFAMQTYSAIPDISADNEAGVATLATRLGQKSSLWFCFIAYALSLAIGLVLVGTIILPLGLTYLVLMTYSIVKPGQIFAVYKIFPLVNSLVGFLLCVILLAQSFGVL